MTTINLKNFYPWYTHDEYIEVSEKVTVELSACSLPASRCRNVEGRELLLN